MNYSKILEELNSASLFDLYRLQQAIRRSLEDPVRIGKNKGYAENRAGHRVLRCKLNQKTASVLVGATRWKVSYGLLSSIIEGELGGETHLIEGQVLSRD